MLTIWKYSVSIGENIIKLPLIHKWLDFKLQQTTLCAWALVDDSVLDQSVRLRVVGTGHEVPKLCGDYVGTAQDGPFVWHCFAETIK